MIRLFSRINFPEYDRHIHANNSCLPYIQIADVEETGQVHMLALPDLGIPMPINQCLTISLLPS